MKVCQWRHCFETASWRPVLLVWAAGYPPESHDPGELAFDLPVCDAHMNGMKVEHLMCDEGWEAIREAFKRMHKAEPDRESLQIRFEPV